MKSHLSIGRRRSIHNIGVKKSYGLYFHPLFSLFLFFFSWKKRDMASPFEGLHFFPLFFLYNAQLKYVDDSAQQFSLIFLLWPNICGLIYYPLISLSLSFFPTRFGLMVQSYTSSQLYSSTSSSSLVLSDCSRERESLPSCSAVSGLQGILLSSHKYSERKKKKTICIHTRNSVVVVCVNSLMWARTRPANCLCVIRYKLPSHPSWDDSYNFLKSNLKIGSKSSRFSMLLLYVSVYTQQTTC